MTKENKKKSDEVTQKDEIKNVKKELKVFVKELKHFKKISKEDYEKAVKLAQNLINKVDVLKVKPIIFNDKDKLKEMNRTKEALLLYISQIKSIEEFKGKWNKN